MSKNAQGAMMASPKPRAEGAAPARRSRSARARPDCPGGPGAMAALRRAQEELRAMGIKLYNAPTPRAPTRAAVATARSAGRKR